jgi:mycoredoxin
MPEKMIVYTTSWCGDCRRLKNKLKENNIPYEERDIEKDEAAYQTMMGYTKGKRVIPTVEFGGKILINPRFRQVQEALGISQA